MTNELKQRVHANALRILAMDMVQQANSGHPGAPMGMADLAEVLWRDFLVHDPRDPSWVNRDRFVLSNGHASALLYSLLHLSGYDLSLEDLRQFRQLHSKTPGHPEYRETPGVETTTGPLGQGLANAVGMALAEKILAARFNQPGFPVIDHHTWVFLGDGCLMEGISHEVCSLAGTLGLGKLIAVYDDNGISIDGEVEGWFSDDTALRFRSYGWRVIGPVDGHDRLAIQEAYRQACVDSGQPVLVIARTVIGLGAPTKQGQEICHGSPLGPDEIRRAREQLGWSEEPFSIPETIRQEWLQVTRGQSLHDAWASLWTRYEDSYPKLAKQLKAALKGDIDDQAMAEFERWIMDTQAQGINVATRKASQDCLQQLGPLLPELLGGSADLAGSNLTLWKGSVSVQQNASGNYIHYGVREFGMAAIMNGIALHGGFIPYGATFLVFMEYERNALRMASLMQLRLIHVLTHDSIGLGEDGPTHQPVEQLASLRQTPGLSTWRPADATETAVAWKLALERRGPTALVLSRQNLPAVVPKASHGVDWLARIACGGYILRDTDGLPDAVLIATGSEVQIALAAAEQLSTQSVSVRVVSMPSVDVFLAQPVEWQHQVIPPQVRRRVAVEAALKDYWYRFVGLDGAVVGMEGYGASGPAGALYKHFGITVEAVIAAVQAF